MLPRLLGSFSSVPDALRVLRASWKMSAGEHVTRKEELRRTTGRGELETGGHRNGWPDSCELHSRVNARSKPARACRRSTCLFLIEGKDSCRSEPVVPKCMPVTKSTALAWNL
jgi:hypothetical protein